MKHIGIIVILAIGLLGINTCTTRTNKIIVENNQKLSITGEITAIQNGKDGFTATIKDANGKEYYATISFVNSHGSGRGSNYIGNKITVKGSYWKDGKGGIHVTVDEYELK